ncbi:MAG TPA: hypothetical protein PLL33_06795 [Paracoccus sp. (in: a-proteobacteria)]|nr:hypothetical protein [Paracoccus sp. (in: a-proteobacteria)]
MVDENGHPVAVPIDSFTMGLGVGAEHALIILRPYRKDWQAVDGTIPARRVHQFVLDARRAQEPGQALLSYAAQVEKEGSNPRPQQVR